MESFEYAARNVNNLTANYGFRVSFNMPGSTKVQNIFAYPL